MRDDDDTPRPDPAPAPAPAPAKMDPIAFSTLLLSASATVVVYMGWIYTDSYLDLFQLEAAAIGYRVDEYALRGLNVFSPNFLPWIAALPMACLAIGLQIRVLTRRKLLGYGGFALTAGGLLLAVLALAGNSINTYTILVPMTFGLPMLVRPFRDRPLGRGAFVIAAGVSALCLLWSAALYARSRGEDGARTFVNTLAGRTQVSIYSKDQLALNAPGLRRTDLPEGKYRYRYDGLRLLLSRESKYYLIPVITYDQWRHGYGRTITLTEGDDLRLELLPGIRTG